MENSFQPKNILFLKQAEQIRNSFRKDSLTYVLNKKRMKIQKNNEFSSTSLVCFDDHVKNIIENFHFIKRKFTHI